MPEPLSSLLGFLGGAFRREAPVTGDGSIEGACGARVAGNPRLSAAEQVDIYREQFWLRHIDSLREDYPGSQALLGEDGFKAFCRAYLGAHPPKAPSLRDLGADIVAFSRRYEGFPQGRRAVALDMVRYEHAFIDLFDGADPPPLDAGKLQSLPEEAWETARIALHPLLVRMRVEYPVHKLRLAAMAGEPLVVPEGPSPVYLALYRRDLRIQFEELDPIAFDLLEALARGEALVPACARITADLDAAQVSELEPKIGAWFQQWAARGFIADVIP